MALNGTPMPSPMQSRLTDDSSLILLVGRHDQALEDLSRRVEKLEEPRSRISWHDLAPFVWSLLVLALGAAGRWAEAGTLLRVFGP